MTRRKPDLTHEQIQEIKALRTGGMPMPDIAKSLNVSHCAVKKHASNLYNPNKHLSDDEKKQILIEREKGRTLTDIAKDYGVSHFYINKVCKAPEITNEGVFSYQKMGMPFINY